MSAMASASWHKNVVPSAGSCDGLTSDYGSLMYAIPLHTPTVERLPLARRRPGRTRELPLRLEFTNVVRRLIAGDDDGVQDSNESTTYTESEAARRSAFQAGGAIGMSGPTLSAALRAAVPA